MADLASLTAAFNAADAAGDTVAAQQLHDALQAAMSEAGGAPTAEAPKRDISTAESAVQGAAHMSSFGLDASAGGAIRKAMTEYVDPLLYGVFNADSGDPQGDPLSRALQFGGAADKGPLQSINDYVQDQKGYREAAYDAHPVAYGAGAVGGAVLGGGLSAEVAGVRGLATAGKTAMEVAKPLLAEGAAIGGTFGAGAATEQDTSKATPAELAANFALDTGVGALTGAAANVVATPALQAIGNVVGRVGTFVKGLLGRPAEVNAKAVRDLGVAMRNAGMTADDLQKAFDRNPQLVLADFLPETVANVATSGRGGPGRQELADFASRREDTALRTIAPLLRKAMGLADQDVSYSALQLGIARTKQEAAQPLYDAAEKVPMDLTPVMQRLLATEQGAGAYAKAKSSIASRFDPYPPDVRVTPPPAPSPNPEPVSDFAMFRPTPPDPGSPTTGKNLINTLKETLRNLGDDAGSLIRDGRRAEAASVMKIKKDLQAEIGRINQPFAEASAIWAEGSGASDAATEGLKMFRPSTTVDSLRSTMADMNQAEREAFRISAMSDLEHRLGNIGDLSEKADTGVKNIIGTPNLKNKLVLLLGDEAKASNVRQLLLDRQRMHQMFLQTLKNPTAARPPTSLPGAVIGQGLTAAVMPHVAGGPYIGRQTGSKAVGMLGQRQAGIQNEQLANILLTRDPKALTKAVQSGLLGGPATTLGGAASMGAGATVPGLLPQVQFPAVPQ
jgi:hypothetical protein